MDSPETLHPLQVEAWRRMTYREKWELARAAQRMVIDATRRRILRQRHDLSAPRLAEEVARSILRGNS